MEQQPILDEAEFYRRVEIQRREQEEWYLYGPLPVFEQVDVVWTMQPFEGQTSEEWPHSSGNEEQLARAMGQLELNGYCNTDTLFPGVNWFALMYLASMIDQNNLAMVLMVHRPLVGLFDLLDTVAPGYAWLIYYSSAHLSFDESVTFVRGFQVSDNFDATTGTIVSDAPNAFQGDVGTSPADVSGNIVPVQASRGFTLSLQDMEGLFPQVDFGRFDRQQLASDDEYRATVFNQIVQEASVAQENQDMSD